MNEKEFIIDKYSFYPNKIAKHNKKDKTIQFDAECGIGDLIYELKHDTLFLEDAIGNNYIGFSCDSICCNIQEDYFRGLKIQIELPIITDELNKKAEEFDKENTISIFIGKPIKKYQAEYGIKNRVQINDTYIGLKELKFHLDQLKKSRKKELKFLIFKSDYSKSSNTLSNVIQEIEREGFDIYYVYSNKETGGTKPFKTLYYMKNL